MAQWVTTAEAMQLLRLSRRSIERRIADGTLLVRRDGRRRWVAVPDDAPGIADDATDTTAAQLAQVMAQCADLSAENARLRQRVSDLASDKDYLQSALAAALVLQQKAIPERTGQPGLFERARQWLLGAPAAA